MRAYRLDFAVVHYYNTVGVLHRGDTLRDNYFRGIGNFIGKRLAYKRVGLCVNRACRVVKNKYFGLFKQRSCDTQPLLLTA